MTATLVAAAAIVIGVAGYYVTFPFLSSSADLGVAGALAGGGLAGILLAKWKKISTGIVLDTLASAAAIAYGIAALGFALAPTSMHPAPLYEFLIGIAMFSFLWTEGRAAMQWQRPNGIVVGEFLVLFAFAQGLITLAARPEQRPALASAWLAGAGSLVAGGITLATLLKFYFKTREEHRIVDHVTILGEGTQPEWTPPTQECPFPERWKMYDPMTAEVETLEFLTTLVTFLKPSVIVETGTFMGISTLALAGGLRRNGFGKIITVEFDPKVFAKAKERIEASGLKEWIDCRNESSLEMKVEGNIDLLFSDSDPEIREAEVRHFLPQICENGLILMHDASSHFGTVREAALRLEREGLISMCLVPTPRGMVIGQKLTGTRARSPEIVGNDPEKSRV